MAMKSQLLPAVPPPPTPRSVKRRTPRGAALGLPSLLSLHSPKAATIEDVQFDERIDRPRHRAAGRTPRGAVRSPQTATGGCRPTSWPPSISREMMRYRANPSAALPLLRALRRGKAPRSPSPEESAEEPALEVREERSVEEAVWRQEGFQDLARLAKIHELSLSEVRSRREEFEALDANGSGTLEIEELEVAVRQRCNIPSNEETPRHLLEDQWLTADTDGSGHVTFEEYLRWSLNIAQFEEVMVPCPNERILRRVSRDQGYHPLDIEKVKVVFDRIDTDASGFIDKSEFREALARLMNAGSAACIPSLMFERYWREANTERNGRINFEEFTVWYLDVFGGGSTLEAPRTAFER